jgi:hypothetical protein
MTPVTRERVLTLIHAYGADPARWPDAECNAARQLAETDPELRRAMDAAYQLDAVLDRLPDPRSAPALRVALNEIPDHSAGLLELVVGWLGVWRPAAGMAVAMGLGVVIGATNPDLPVPGFDAPSRAVADVDAGAEAVGFDGTDIF